MKSLPLKGLHISTRYHSSPFSLFDGVIRHRGLLVELVRRDFVGRYKGSFMGIAWSFFKPLIMLGIYTLVFSVALKAKWGMGGNGKATFAIVLFSGLIVHNFFSECITRAPLLIIENPNYVKKVVFPLEILPWMSLISALLHSLLSFVVLLIFCFVASVPLYGGVFLVPLLLLPLFFMTIGLSWIFASLGVYLRDLSQVMGTVSSITLFMSPIFYPVGNLPELFRKIIFWNPISLPVIQIREVMLLNRPIQWEYWGIAMFVGLFASGFGYWWFQKTRRGFSDVL